jgi:hypothetical protein
MYRFPVVEYLEVQRSTLPQDTFDIESVELPARLRCALLHSVCDYLKEIASIVSGDAGGRTVTTL